MSKKLLVKEFTEPTDIYILGDYLYDDNIVRNIALTDDECTVSIRRGRGMIDINTFGFVFILTTEEVAKNINFINEDSIADGMFIEEFKGKIFVNLVSMENDEDGSEFKEDVDITDYLYHQTTVDGADVEIEILIEDDDSWKSHIFYNSFPVNMISKLVQCVKSLE